MCVCAYASPVLLTDGPHAKCKQRIMSKTIWAHSRHQDGTNDKFAGKTTAVALMNRCNSPEIIILKKKSFQWIYTAAFCVRFKIDF